MEIEYTLAESDILALMQYRLQLRHGRDNPVLVRRLGYFIGFTLLGLGTGLLLHDLAVAIAFLALAVISFTLYPRLFDWLIRRKVSAAYRDPKNKATLAARILRASRDGLEEKSDMGEIKVNWEVVNDLATTPSHAFFTIHNSPSLVVPVERISQGDFQEFVKACREYIQGAAA